MQASETPREISFCAHTILGDDLLVVENALEDERFKDNPLVLNDPGIRFYAAQPLITSRGFKIGTLCTIDQSPRRFSPEQRKLLANLGNQVMRLIELRSSNHQLEERDHLLRGTQEQLFLALKSARMGSWSIDLKTEIVTTSPSFADIFGVPKVERNIYEEISRYMHPQDVAEVNRVWTTAAANRTFYDHTYRIVWPDGSVHWVHSRGTVKLDPSGEPAFFSGVLSDVTEDVVIRKRVEESEARIQQIADAMPQIVWTARPDGVLNYTNQRWLEYSGSSDPERWLDYVHPDDLENVTESWSKSVQSGGHYETEFRLRRLKDHSYRWFLARAQPAYDSLGKLEKWIGTCTDIQEQRAALEARSEFMSIASHELKTPLTSLKLQLQSMQRRFDNEKSDSVPIEKVRELVGSNNKQVNRLIRLVDDMLDLSKIEAGKLSIVKEESSLNELVTEVYARLKDQLDAAGCSAVLNFSQSITCSIDRFRIEQVVTNLLTNAIRYGRSTPITIGLEQVGEFARFSINDQGMGIAPENRERIFNRFERAVSVNEVSGLGLGLFISKQIIDRHQGQIWVESEVGKGSIFYFEIPLLYRLIAFYIMRLQIRR